MKLLIIIPAYNEQGSICKVMDELKNEYPQYDSIVVNDGSKDKTKEICMQNNYPILDLPVNLGLAGAVQTGLKYAKENNYDCAVQLDGDGQHSPKFIVKLLEKMQNDNADIVIGSRFVTIKKPKSLRMFGSYLISWAMRLTTGQKICDPTSGMRLYNKKMIDEFSSDTNYTPEPDTVSYLIKNGAKISEVQVEMNERTSGKSYLTFTRSAYYMLRMGASIIFIQFIRKRR